MKYDVQYKISLRVATEKHMETHRRNEKSSLTQSAHKKESKDRGRKWGTVCVGTFVHASVCLRKYNCVRLLRPLLIILTHV